MDNLSVTIAQSGAHQQVSILPSEATVLLIGMSKEIFATFHSEEVARAKVHLESRKDSAGIDRIGYREIIRDRQFSTL